MKAGLADGTIQVVEVVPCAEDLVLAESPAVEEPVGDEDTDDAVSATSGDWVIGDIESDPLTDEPTALLGLISESGTNAFGDPITLLIRCRNGETDLFISWGDYLGSGPARVTTRVGYGEPRARRWSLSTDGTATFLTGDAISFVKNLIGETSLVAQTQPYREGNSKALFDLTGIEDALVNVREACNW